jgi:hypothetical protein
MSWNSATWRRISASENVVSSVEPHVEGNSVLGPSGDHTQLPHCAEVIVVAPVFHELPSGDAK